VLWRCWLGNKKDIRPVKKLSGGMLAWLCVWVKVQICIWPSWCHCQSLSLAPVNPDWFYLSGAGSPGYFRTKSKRIVFVCVCVCYMMFNRLPSVLRHCWLGGRKNISLKHIEWWGVVVVICLKQSAYDSHMVQLMPLPSHRLLLH